MIYIENETGTEYFVHSKRAKMKIGDKYYNAVVFTEHSLNTQIFVMQIDEFYQRFEKK